MTHGVWFHLIYDIRPRNGLDPFFDAAQEPARSRITKRKQEITRNT